MIFAVYSGQDDDSVAGSLGTPDYSYFFVLKSYLPVLEKLGAIFYIRSIERDGPALEKLAGDCEKKGEPLVLLMFSPPRLTGLEQRLPVITVLAWEYSTIPNEAWEGNSQHDWSFILRRQGQGISLSQYATATIREAMGNEFPVATLPAPVWDAHEQNYRASKEAILADAQTLTFHGSLLDSRQLDFSSISIDHRDADLAALVARTAPPGDQTVLLDGVIYSIVMNPIDGRKNWLDSLLAFCLAFRDHGDATLVIKVTHFDPDRVWSQYIAELYKLAPFKCRVVLVHGYLDSGAYSALVRNSSFTVNCAHGEGQCMPLTEFMSAGVPAIAPDHTAMADYINQDNAFVVKSSREWTHWPHDHRLTYRAMRYRIDWQSLHDAFLASYQVAKSDVERYQAMSQRAHADLRDHCSRAVVTDALREYLSCLPTRKASKLQLAMARLFGNGIRRRLLRKYSTLLERHEGDGQGDRG